MPAEYFLFDVDASTEWQILRSIRPAFPSKIQWKCSNPSDGPHLLWLETFNEELPDDIDNIELYCPQRFLSKPEFDSCRSTLRTLLGHLEDLMVEAPTPLLSPYGTLLNQGMRTFLRITQTAAKAVTTTVRTLLRSRDPTLAHELNVINTQYPKLLALGKFVQQAADPVGIVMVNDKYGTFSGISLTARSLLKTFASMAGSIVGPSTPILCGPTEDEVSLGDRSFYLIKLLSDQTIGCFSYHQAKLKLDASILGHDQRPMSMEVLLSPCSGASETCWNYTRFTFIESENQEQQTVFDLCKHIRDSPNFEFTNMNIFRPVSTSISHHSSPIMETRNISLSKLIASRALVEGGPFSPQDKAALALSLARWFSYLLQSPCMQGQWSTSQIYFSREEDFILTPNRPFIECKLDDPGDLSELSAAECQKFLWAFATLLLEIETGQSVNIDGSQNPKEDIWNIVRPLETKKRECAEYFQAILACADFLKLTNTSRATPLLSFHDSTISVDDIRKTMCSRVIEKLKEYCRVFFQDVDSFISDRIDLPVDLDSVMAAVITSPTRSSCSFNSNLVHTADNQALTATEVFRTKFKQFRRRFIEPKMTRELRKNTERIRIAILDTGIRERDGDSGLEDYRGQVVGYREARHFSDLNPVNKMKKCWIEGDEGVDDICGHGTHLACLLLEFAPDADLYIGKISSGMDFPLHKGIAKAIKWAAEVVRADIITMSFGLNGYSMGINDAIRYALQQTTIDGHQPLFFASASNNGLNERRTFPAKDERVICVHAVDGLGSHKGINFNPPLEDNVPNFGTLGVGIGVKWDGETEYKGGTSYATPILASIVANYLDWLGHMHRHEGLGTEQYRLLRQRGLVEKFLVEKMATKQENSSGMSFIAPWHWLSFMGHDVRPDDPIPDAVKERDDWMDKTCLSGLIAWLGDVNA